MADTHRPDLFRHTVANLRFGELEDELTAQLAELVRACRDTGKAGELTLTIRIKPKPRSGQVFIEDTVKLKKPQLPKEDTILFLTDEDNLQREDPRQHRLQLKDVSSAEAPARARDIEAEPTAFREAR